LHYNASAYDNVSLQLLRPNGDNILKVEWNPGRIAAEQ
jgi:hypothetical protein